MKKSDVRLIITFNDQVTRLEDKWLATEDWVERREIDKKIKYVLDLMDQILSPDPTIQSALDIWG